MKLTLHVEDGPENTVRCKFDFDPLLADGDEESPTVKLAACFFQVIKLMADEDYGLKLDDPTARREQA